MPNPHFRVNHITRQKGQNAVASAAYRAGEALENYRNPENSVLNAAAYRSGGKLTDERRGQVFSFVRKEGVLHSEVFSPANAPEWVSNREKLWNEVERAEDKSTRRATARLARDFVASLPRELSHEQHRAMVAAFVADNFTSRGLVADVAFHSVKARDGGMNPHVHMMVATRNVNADGFGGKARWLDRKDALTSWRGSWEKHTNDALEAAGREERLSLKSYKEQGIELEGRKWLTRGEYELEEKGISTKRGDENRDIAERNRVRAANDNDKRDVQPRPTPPAGLNADVLTEVHKIGNQLFTVERGQAVSDDQNPPQKPEARASIEDAKEVPKVLPYQFITGHQQQSNTANDSNNWVGRTLIDEPVHTPGKSPEERNNSAIESRLSGGRLAEVQKLGGQLQQNLRTQGKGASQTTEKSQSHNKGQGYER